MAIDEEAFEAAKLVYEAEFDTPYVTFKGLGKAIEAYEQAKKSVMGDASTRKDEAVQALVSSPATDTVLVKRLVEALKNLREWPETVNYYVAADKALTEADAWLERRILFAMRI